MSPTAADLLLKRFTAAGCREPEPRAAGRLARFLLARDERMWATIASIELQLGDMEGEVSRAETWFGRADRKEPPGNFPQAFSHVGLINAAWRLAEARQVKEERP